MEYSINIRRVIIIIEDVVFTGTYESLPFSLGTAVQLPSENVDPEMCSLEGARLFCRENTHKRTLMETSNKLSNKKVVGVLFCL